MRGMDSAQFVIRLCLASFFPSFDARLPFFLNWLSDDEAWTANAGPGDDYQNTIFSLARPQNGTDGTPGSPARPERPGHPKWTVAAAAGRTNHAMPPRNFSESFFGGSEQDGHAVSRDGSQSVRRAMLRRPPYVCPEIRKEGLAAVTSPILIPNNRIFSLSVVHPSLLQSYTQKLSLWSRALVAFFSGYRGDERLRVHRLNSA